MVIQTINLASCEKQHISLAEFCRRIGQTLQNFNKKLQWETVKAEEMIAIADALGLIFEQRFILEDGSEIRFNNIGGT